MMIACVGYKFGSNRINVEYDKMNKKYFVHSERFFYYVKSKKQVQEIIKDFKKSYND